MVLPKISEASSKQGLLFFEVQCRRILQSLTLLDAAGEHEHTQRDERSVWVSGLAMCIRAYFWYGLIYVLLHCSSNQAYTQSFVDKAMAHLNSVVSGPPAIYICKGECPS